MKELTILSSAVLVRVIAAEDYTSLVGGNNTVKPADRASS